MPSPQYSLGKKKETYEHTVPSGEVCLLKKLGLNDLIAGGVLDSFDELTAMVKEMHLDRVAGKPNQESVTDEATLTILQDPIKRRNLLTVADSVTVLAVVDPQVWPVPDPKAANASDRERKSDRLYVDDVDMLDKFSIMSQSIVGIQESMAAMKPFRPGSEPNLADVAAGKNLPHKAKQAAKGKKRRNGVLPGPSSDSVRNGDGKRSRTSAGEA